MTSNFDDIDEPSIMNEDEQDDLYEDNYDYYQKLGEQFVTNIKEEGGYNQNILSGSVNKNNSINKNKESIIETNIPINKINNKTVITAKAKENQNNNTTGTNNSNQTITVKSKQNINNTNFGNSTKKNNNPIITPIKINSPLPSLKQKLAPIVNNNNSSINNSLKNSKNALSNIINTSINNNASNINYSKYDNPELLQQNDKAFKQMDYFDKNLYKKKINSYEKEDIIDEDELDSEDEDFKIKEELTNIALIEKEELFKRFNILQRRYKQSQLQITNINTLLIEERNKQKDLVEMFAKDDNNDIKDRKLVELVKKNTDLNLKIEKYKLKEKEQDKKLSSLEAVINKNPLLARELENNNINNTNTNNVNYNTGITVNNNNSFLNNNNSNNIGSNLTNAITHDEISSMKRKIKQLESRLSELSNKNQTLKTENFKLDALLKKELGDNYLDNEKNWKGRAEIMEGLKSKIKFLESIINNGNFNNNALNTIKEENEEAITGDDSKLNNHTITKENKTSVINNHITINKLTNNLIPYSQYKKEKESFKSEITGLQESKTKLTLENSKLKSRKDVLEKELKQQKDAMTAKLKLLIEKSDNDEKLINALNSELEKKTGKSLLGGDVMFNLQQEILSLREKLRKKTEEFEALDKKLGSKDVSLFGLFQKIEDLEKENNALRSLDDNSNNYDALTRDNAKLRLQVAELKIQIQKMNNS